MNENERIIHEIILEMDKPFLISDLLIKLSKSGLTDINMILKVLDQLLNSGLVSFDDLDNDDNNMAYCSIFASTAN